MNMTKEAACGCLTLVQLSRAAWALPAAENTMPGLSSRVTFLSRCTSCTVVVTPGVFPVAAACFRFRLLISELLPTLGRPTTPAGRRVTRRAVSAASLRHPKHSGL